MATTVTAKKVILQNSLGEYLIPFADSSSTGGGGLEICDIGMSLYVDETKGLRRRLNGQLMAITGNQKAFLKRLQEIIALYPTLACTEDEWQVAKTLSAFGQVGKFVLNYAEDGVTVESVRLPAVVNVQGLLDLSNLGMTVGAGLPNITGQLNIPLYTNRGLSGAFYQKSSGGVFDYGSNSGGYTAGFEASLSNSIYGSSNTVQQESIVYPYFIQINTGQETKNNIVNDIELNNPFTLLESKYSPDELHNASWLASKGQWNPKAIYVTVYEGLVVEHNTEIAVGTTVTLPSGTNYTKRGLSVKLSTDSDITDYDFVINTEDETFRLPLKTTKESKRELVKSVVSGNKWYNLYSDGWCDQGGTGDTTFLIPFKDTTYGVAANTNAGVYYATNISGKSTTSFTKYQWQSANGGGGNYNVTWLASGYVDMSYVTETTNLTLYFYVGDTVQNPSLIDTTRCLDEIAEINARPHVIETYQNGTSGYRLWSPDSTGQKWCEQWGKVVASGDTFSYPVTLLKKYKTADYIVNMTATFTSTYTSNTGTANVNSVAVRSGLICDRTTTSFKIAMLSNTIYKNWKTEGYVA